jgi:hypothetical protein
MWMLFGAASKKKPIPGGAREERWCNECKAERTFVECEIHDKVDVFFVPVLQGTTRGMMCSECGEDLEAQPIAERPKRTVAAPPKRTYSEKEKDAMLAALKKKMVT